MAHGGRRQSLFSGWSCMRQDVEKEPLQIRVMWISGLVAVAGVEVQ